MATLIPLINLETKTIKYVPKISQVQYIYRYNNLGGNGMVEMFCFVNLDANAIHFVVDEVCEDPRYYFDESSLERAFNILGICIDCLQMTVNSVCLNCTQSPPNT